MYSVSIETDAAEKLMAMMQRRVRDFAQREMSTELVEWEVQDLNRKRPETEQPASDRVETKLRNPPRGADGWKWWEDQEREPMGTPEGGEFMSFPPGHWALRRKRRRGRIIKRGRGRTRRGLGETLKRRAVGAVRRRFMRIVTPGRVRRFRRMRRMATLPGATIAERRIRRAVGVPARGRPSARFVRRVTGVRPVLRPQLGSRLGMRMTRAMIRGLRWR